MNTLLVHFLPRGATSNTRRLLDTFRKDVSGGIAEEVDLAAHVPPMFDAERIPLYVRRNYAGEALTDHEASALHVADRLTEQLIRANLIVLAFPMYNFSVPAAVKAWMDCVTQKGRTWTVEDGRYRGLLSGRKALILMTSGGHYSGARAHCDHAGPLAKQVFEFMGISEIELVHAQGMNSDIKSAENQIQSAEREIRRIAQTWYSPTLACL